MTWPASGVHAEPAAVKDQDRPVRRAPRQPKGDWFSNTFKW
jgi:hypothetical protein